MSTSINIRQLWAILHLLVGITAAQGTTVCLAQGTKPQPSGREPSLLQQLKLLSSGAEQERKEAAHAISQELHYYGYGELDPAMIVPILARAATEDPVEYVREYCVEALCRMEHELCVPTFIKLLSNKKLSRGACDGLKRLGTRAKEAIPSLTKGIEDNSLPVGALAALLAIQRKKALPLVLRKLEDWKLKRNDRQIAAWALLDYPDPASIPFMEIELRSGARVVAALFFSKLDHPTSLAKMRECLHAAPSEKARRIHPFDREWKIAQDLRQIAVDYLARHQDKSSYNTMLKMVTSDDSINVRTAAVRAMGIFGREAAVPALASCFSEEDKGYESIGHRDGTLHKAVVEALGKIGTPNAFNALFDGMVHGQARDHCIRFWREAKQKEVFEKFLALLATRPLDDQIAARIISRQLYVHRKHYTVSERDIPAAKEEFLKDVRDAEHFGQDVDLTRGGALKAFVRYTFYRIGYAKVDFSFRPKDPRGYGSGYTIVYKRKNNTWIPMAKVGGYVE